ncbi:MAG: ferredoxin--NADP reductase [Polyangiales bacterium]
MRLVIGEETAATHARHGQYVEVTEGDEHGYFVIASAPGERTWDLLVRDGGTMGDRLRAAPLGTTFDVSSAQGKGFPVESAKGHPLVLAATGSGIAAVLSVIGVRIEEGDAKRTFLLYGVRQRTDVALSAELEAMRAEGVDVAICLSREHASEPGFFRGYVQDIAKERSWHLQNGLIFAAGNDAMIEGMREAAPLLGLPPHSVKVNA